MKSSDDIQHLQLLSIFHFVVAGILGVFSLFPIIHIIVGIAMVTGAFDDAVNGTPPPEFLGWVFILIPGTFMLCGFTIAICVAIAGQRLKTKRSYVYCLIIAGIECIFMPIGTVLGAFTIIVLMRPTVKELFGVDQ